MSSTLNAIICCLDFAAAFVIVALMLETTPHASVAGFLRGEAQSRWAMFRRFVYTMVAVAVFAKAIFVLDGTIKMQTPDAVIWIIVIFALFIFPALRAAGVVNQDQWVGFGRAPFWRFHRH